MEDYKSRHTGVIPAAPRGQPVAPAPFPAQQQHGVSMPMHAGPPAMPVPTSDWAPRPSATWQPHGPSWLGHFHPPCVSGGGVPEPLHPPSWKQPMMSTPQIFRAPAVPEPLIPPTWHPGMMMPHDVPRVAVAEPKNTWSSQPFMVNQHVAGGEVPEPMNFPPSPTVATTTSKAHGPRPSPPWTQTSHAMPSPPVTKVVQPAPAPSQSPGLRPKKDLFFSIDTSCHLIGYLHICCS